MGEREADRRVEELFRAEWAGLVGAAARIVGGLEYAEELAQETLATALERWREGELPRNPAAWLRTAVKNRAIDHVRRANRERTRAPLLRHELGAATATAEGDEPASDAIEDDRLRLVFTCCHPVLSREARVALTLRMVGGLSTREIARAFLASEATIAQRLVRAKKRIRERRIPYVVPRTHELPERLPSVLDVLYLIFNEGYAARAGDAWIRAELCDEAIRLARLVAERMPDEGEVHALVALMELQSSRAEARTGRDGGVVLLPDQDRERWDRARIARGLESLERARSSGPPGRFWIESEIAACHARAASWEETDWRRILRHYDVLLELRPSPVVELNRAVAIAELEGAEAGLAALERASRDGALDGYALAPATRADFLRRLARFDEAVDAYAEALELTANRAERDFLEQRLAECREPQRDENA